MKPAKRLCSNEELLKERYDLQPKYTLAVRDLHQTRCKDDLLHMLLSIPTNTARLDQILQAAFNMITKKYSPDFARSRAASSLMLHAVDDDAKLFALLFILSKETEMQNMMRLRQTSEDGRARYDVLLPALQNMFQQAFNWSFGKLNIIRVVRDLVHCARKTYMMEL